jgi:hypothetical protein
MKENIEENFIIKNIRIPCIFSLLFFFFNFTHEEKSLKSFNVEGASGHFLSKSASELEENFFRKNSRSCFSGSFNETLLKKSLSHQ